MFDMLDIYHFSLMFDARCLFHIFLLDVWCLVLMFLLIASMFDVWCLYQQQYFCLIPFIHKKSWCYLAPYISIWRRVWIHSLKIRNLEIRNLKIWNLKLQKFKNRNMKICNLIFGIWKIGICKFRVWTFELCKFRIEHWQLNRISLLRTFFGFQFRIATFQNQRIKTLEQFLLNLWARFRLLWVTIPICYTYGYR